MQTIYTDCPVWQSDRFLLRRAETRDAAALVKVYGDLNALPFFNSDNCDGDNFYYPTEAIMLEHMGFWEYAYQVRAFVRFAILDKQSGEVVGTVELFNRQAKDAFTDCGLLRLDVRPDYERAQPLEQLLALITPNAYEAFECGMIATKAPIYAVERVAALKRMGYEKSGELLVGGDGSTFRDYWCAYKDKRA